MGISYDESYYWVYSQSLSFGYFDHPPAVSIMIKLGTFIFGSNLFGIKTFSNILTLLSYFLFLNKSQLSEKYLVTTLFFSFPLLSSAGVLALPDTLFLFFVTLFFSFIEDYLKTDSFKNLVIILLSIVGMLYSKYHGFLVISLTLIAIPSLIRRKSFWVITFTSIVLYTPHILWQYNHEFITLKYHLLGRGKAILSIQNVTNYLVSIFTVFGLFLSLMLAKTWKYETPYKKILVFNLYGLILFLFILSFRNRIEGNWLLSAVVAFMFLLMKIRVNSKKVISLSALSFGILFLLKIGLIFQKDFNIKRLDEFDSWDNLVSKVVSYANNRIIVGEAYQHCAKFSFYYKKLIPCLHLNSRSSQFSLINNLPDKKEEILYLSNKKQKNTKVIDIGYNRSIYLKKISFEKLLLEHGLSYEQYKKSRY